MNHGLAHVALVVRNYDEAIAFYVDKLGFDLVEDMPQPEREKRWVVVRPRGDGACSLLLARAATPRQARCIGDQSGGRVFLFLRTDDVWRDYHAFTSRQVAFEREPEAREYGIVAVFGDLYGNRWDLVQFTDGRG